MTLCVHLNLGIKISLSSKVAFKSPSKFMSIILENLTKRYGNQFVVDDVSLEVTDGELFVLLGASGSGKSTILRMIAGLSTPSSGRILLHERDVTALTPQERGTGFVFQNYSIFR